MKATTCLTEDCGRQAVRRPGYCRSHYLKLRHLGQLPPQLRCPTNRCTYFQAKAGVCTNCYGRGRYALIQDKAKDRYWNRGGKEKRKAYCARPETKKLRAASSMRRYCKKLNATPAWADEDKVQQIYANCPEGYEVDHIIPLQGKNVCGLHVEYNLQYLRPSENQAKGNKVLL